MFIVLSRVKTNGSYILPPKYDPLFNNYGNRIDLENSTKEICISYIINSKDKNRVFYI